MKGPSAPPRLLSLFAALLLFAPAVWGEEPPLPPPEVPAGEHRHVHPPPPAQPDPGRVGLEEKLGTVIPLDVPFKDENGRTVRLRELVDRPTIIAPVYYKCPNVCNFLQGGLAQALPEVSLKPGEKYRVLSVSFDETETPELARGSKRNYLAAARGKIPPDAWRFLTGEREDILTLTDALGYRFQRQGVDFLHPVAIAVVSPEGKIVRYLYGTRFLPMDLTLSLVEASEGKVGATVKRVLGFCFSYDPQGKRYVFNILRVSAVVVLATAGAFIAFLLLAGRKRRG